MKKIAQPEYDEYAQYYQKYIDLVNKDVSVLDQLKLNATAFKSFLKELNEDQLQYAYAPDKWTIKDILMHLIDVERVFLYRAMRFSRFDKTPLPFFDENEYAKNAAASKLSIGKLLKEYTTCRAASLAFFNNLGLKQLKARGVASNATMTARACAWIIAGHELHHWSVIKEKYIK
jgi:uncharacterized damage-inducible protein DinB